MKKYLSIISITLAIVGSGCKKDYLNLVNNPNVPSTASPNLLLTGAMKTTAGIVNGSDYTMYAAWVGYLSQSTGFQPFVTLEQYQFTTSTYQAPWNDNYLNLSNYNALMAATAEPNYQAIAQIMMVYDWEALVDNFNDIPYSQALQGAKVLNPSYDKGSAVYADLMKKLDAAIVMIQKAPSTAANPAGADIMYGGNMTNWIKFANTLKLRLCIREEVNGPDKSNFEAAVKATASLGYLDATNAALVNPGYANVDANGGQQSPLWLYYGETQSGGQQAGKAEYQANSYAANYYASNSDPRLIEVFSGSITPDANTGTGVTQGSAINVQNGVAIVSTTFGDSQPPLATVDGKAGVQLAPSLVGPGLLTSPSMDAVIMSAPESLFLQAEATARGILPGSAAGAQTLYNAGITASFEFDQVPNADAAATAYYGQTAIAYPLSGSLTEQVDAIIMQKWAALNLFGAFEAFNEERRTGIPAVPTSIYPGADAPHQVSRILYPFVEYQTNAAAVAAEGNIDKFNSKIFWAQ